MAAAAAIYLLCCLGAVAADILHTKASYQLMINVVPQLFSPPTHPSTAIIFYDAYTPLNIILVISGGVALAFIPLLYFAVRWVEAGQIPVKG